MTVGVLTVKLYAPWAHSLKEKRMIVKGLCDRLRNKFNVSVIESGAQDIHQTILISVAFLAASAAMADSIGENISRFIESNTDAEIVEINFENR
ncbi:MAG TPA: DUF503 domain-containing protein [Candidatus Avimonas sp.]|nr:DUF503 domain-containing protein [Candidatus Avimonas sp.]